MALAVETPARCTVYRRRRPEHTPLYRAVQGHLETYLALARDGHTDADGVPQYVEGEFRRYLECGILAHGFARARCAECGHDFLIAFSCKGRALCPSCNARRMAEVAAHLVDQVFPPLPVRQWVLAVPKRLRYFLLAAIPRRSARCCTSCCASSRRGCAYAAAARAGGWAR